MDADIDGITSDTIDQHRRGHKQSIINRLPKPGVDEMKNDIADYSDDDEESCSVRSGVMTAFKSIPGQIGRGSGKKVDEESTVGDEQGKRRSAPVNVPSLGRREMFDEVIAGLDDEDYVDDDGMLLLPHEMVKVKSTVAAAPSSVLEGAGRTLKGRDLRRVRNTVLKQTGFLD